MLKELRVRFGNRSYSGLGWDDVLKILLKVNLLKTPVHIEEVAGTLKGVARHVVADVKLLGHLLVQGDLLPDEVACAVDLIHQKYFSKSCRMAGGESPLNCTICASRGGQPACGKSFSLMKDAGVQAVKASVGEIEPQGKEAGKETPVISV